MGEKAKEGAKEVAGSKLDESVQLADAWAARASRELANARFRLKNVGSDDVELDKCYLELRRCEKQDRDAKRAVKLARSARAAARA